MDSYFKSKTPVQGDTEKVDPLQYLGLMSVYNNTLKDEAQTIFPTIDKDNNGHLSPGEVAAAITNPDIKGKSAIVVALLKESLPDIEITHDDPGFDSKGASKEDLKKFFANMDDYEDKTTEAWRIGEYGSKVFDDIDKSGKGYLTKDQLKKYTLPGDGFGYEAGMKRNALSNMIRLFDDVKNASNDEWFSAETVIYKSDLEKYFEVVMRRFDYNAIDKAKDAISQAKLNLFEKKTNSLYANQFNKIDSIKPDAIVQGAVGDCFFLGPLASMASTQAGKQKIMNMIKDNGPDEKGRHTYTVTFPGAPKAPITVAAPTDSEIAIYNGATEHGTWASVLEKAYGKYCNSGVYRRGAWNKYSVDQDALDGSSTMSGHKILSKSYAADKLTLSSNSTNDLSKAISAALNNGQTMTLFSQNILKSTVLGFGENLTNENKLYRGHAYSVIGYNPQTGNVKIRNPWGSGGEPDNADGDARDGRNDGVFELPLAELKKDFDHLQIGK